MKLNLAKFVKYLKRANFILATFFLVLLSVVVYNTDLNKVSAAVNHPSPTAFHIIVNGGSVRDLTVQGLSEHTDSQGVYYVTYRFTYPARDFEIRFPLKGETYLCQGGNGDASGGYVGIGCTNLVYVDNRLVALDSSNNWTQDITFSISQPVQRVCGSFQTDLFAPGSNNQFITGSFYKTGVDCNQPSPSPSPSVIPSPSPSPSPSASPSPSPSPSASPSPSPSVSPSPSPSPSLTCASGQVVVIVNGQAQCQNQNQGQNQGQNQNQNNNQGQSNNQNVVATGGNSSSSSSSNSSVNVTVNGGTNTKEIIREVKTSTPQVVMQTKGDVKELPKTGLPLVAWAISSLLPAGFGIKKFGKKQASEESASSVWTQRQLDK